MTLPTVQWNALGSSAAPDGAAVGAESRARQRLAAEPYNAISAPMLMAGPEVVFGHRLALNPHHQPSSSIQVCHSFRHVGWWSCQISSSTQQQACHFPCMFRNMGKLFFHCFATASATMKSQLMSASSHTDSISPISLVPTSVAVSVDCELLELAVPALPCIWCTCFSFPCQQLAALWPHFSAVITPPLELFALRLFFALPFALASPFPFHPCSCPCLDLCS